MKVPPAPGSTSENMAVTSSAWSGESRKCLKCHPSLCHPPAPDLATAAGETYLAPFFPPRFMIIVSVSDTLSSRSAPPTSWHIASNARGAATAIGDDRVGSSRSNRPPSASRPQLAGSLGSQPRRAPERRRRRCRTRRRTGRTGRARRTDDAGEDGEEGLEVSEERPHETGHGEATLV